MDQLLRSFTIEICLITVLLSGCNGNPADQVTKTAVDSPPRNVLPSVTLINNQSRTPGPTGTDHPTSTPTWIPPTLTPRPPDIEAIIQEYPGLEYYIQPSPSNDWVFMGFTVAPQWGQGITSLLYNRLTGQKWFYAFCTFIQDDPRRFCEGGNFPGEGAIYPFAWSPDGRYFFGELIIPGDGGYGFGGGMKLIRINLHSGVASIYIDIGAVYSFSPVMDRLVYIPWSSEGPHKVIIRDMQDSSEFILILEPKYDVAGDIVWSPDGTQFVFQARDLVESQDDLISTSLMLVDIPSRSREILIKEIPGSNVQFEEWLPGGILKYSSSDDDNTFYDIIYIIPDQQLFITPQP
jgi:hypothetical protein